MTKQLVFLSIATIIVISGCGNNTSQQPVATMNHSDMNMNHPISSEVPLGLKEAKNPTYEVGSQAVIQAEHMPGMKGATATIVGTYDTTAYAVSYTPTTGGQPVKNHKWVILEEIENAGNQTLKPGTEVTLEADHMPGMKGASATIESAEHTTVYVVDYNPTTGGETVKNHKWVIGSELSTK
ncbi:hypothetical protein Back11_15220 [Paenibacillus baekrokdamisoli]|uniref:Uncharacterized protein n=1 Tax=Paenibacillus baekrokdamisoli TaxID=1712516 RepID=A0A3G9IMK6_9BACL|nr:YdhK family protein [Paenibacillus baekrokdamisoli]MBB3072787.1 cold shock CspA family protein [Paenibacillus baekrokdamisoli]BBH20177.1 hypothetical protein Back11_15220 [Paenibacillus baekrokdamisoli]